ncbi:MAG: substrate-binding domain-containing protein [Pseudomonadales bacterium]|nr:substrate-binding domain-containing protein [Pseudomonadales bacterium]
MYQWFKLTLFITLFSPLISVADIAVVVHMDNPLVTLSETEIKGIYKVRQLRFPDNSPIVLSFQPDNVEITEQFSRQVLGRSISQHSRSWTTKIFTGRMLRPKKLTNDLEVIKWVSENRGAIGYIDNANLSNAVKKIATIKSGDTAE